MSYFNIGIAQQYNLTVLKMINKAGRLVEPNAEATLGAMNDFREEIHQGYLKTIARLWVFLWLLIIASSIVIL